MGLGAGVREAILDRYRSATVRLDVVHDALRNSDSSAIIIELMPMMYAIRAPHCSSPARIARRLLEICERYMGGTQPKYLVYVFDFKKNVPRAKANTQAKRRHKKEPVHTGEWDGETQTGVNWSEALYGRILATPWAAEAMFELVSEHMLHQLHDQLWSHQVAFVSGAAGFVFSTDKFGPITIRDEFQWIGSIGEGDIGTFAFAAELYRRNRIERTVIVSLDSDLLGIGMLQCAVYSDRYSPVLLLLDPADNAPPVDLRALHTEISKHYFTSSHLPRELNTPLLVAAMILFGGNDFVHKVPDVNAAAVLNAVMYAQSCKFDLVYTPFYDAGQPVSWVFIQPDCMHKLYMRCAARRGPSTGVSMRLLQRQYAQIACATTWVLHYWINAPIVGAEAGARCTAQHGGRSVFGYDAHSGCIAEDFQPSVETLCHYIRDEHLRATSPTLIGE